MGQKTGFWTPCMQNPSPDGLTAGASDTIPTLQRIAERPGNPLRPVVARHSPIRYSFEGELADNFQAEWVGSEPPKT